MKRRILLVALVLAVLSGFAWLAFRSPEPEPVYQGKTLSQWLSIWGPTKTNLTGQDSIDCSAAVHAIGPKAIPFLLRMLETPDSSWKQRVMDFAAKYKIVETNYLKPSDIRARGQMGLYMLGPEAKTAVPELIRMYDSGVMPEANFANLLGNMGPPAKSAIPKILTTSAAATNELQRAIAIQALGSIHSDASNVVPVLITYLTDKSTFVRCASASALGEYESNAKAAVPALRRLAEQEPPTNTLPRYPPGGGFFIGQQPGAAAIDALSRIDH